MVYIEALPQPKHPLTVSPTRRNIDLKKQPTKLNKANRVYLTKSKQLQNHNKHYFLASYHKQNHNNMTHIVYSFLILKELKINLLSNLNISELVEDMSE